MTKDSDPIKEGAYFLIDKPSGWTSFDVVDRLRKMLKKANGVKKLKVGHAGTLDPLATGLLICCSGPMTKRINEFQEAEKSYRATFRLGQTTHSHDAETEVVEEQDPSHIDEKDLEEVLKNYRGAIEQVPPAYSAVRVEGKRAYEEARKGKDVGLKARNVEVHELQLERYEVPRVTLFIRCGKGTYVRSLARDIGNDLGCGAHLEQLRRTAIGPYRVDDAYTIDELCTLLQNSPDTAQDPERGEQG